MITRLPERVHIDLELEPGSEPIVGELALADGQPIEFVGWMQLTGLLDAIVRSAGSADGRVSPDG